jgi:hypothetical protein
MLRPLLKYFFLSSFLHLLTPVSAQNITDLSVTGRQEGLSLQALNNDVSTVDEKVFLYPQRIRFDNKCVQIENKDFFIFSGSFHYFRVPKPLWADRFRKMKAAGFNCVETYIPWNWHERQMPSSPEDFSKADMSDLEDFLTMAEQFGLYVIVRPGPYICAEWNGGGFPQWLMRKRPKHTKDAVWLQSNDPVFIQWNEHWYKVVCDVVRRHQLTRKPIGQKGVIFIQIENEFNRVKWFSHEEKIDYLSRLALAVRKNGVDIPIITCWTDETRNVKSGPLIGIVDMVNSYPRWKVEKNFGRLIDRQLKSQPGKPLMAGELQGGWMSELGGKLSWEQDGLSPIQTQNITLYALQRGFCLLNYYMVVGGTNFDDWGARQMTTTYDYAAAIGEDGRTNERFRRFQGLSRMIAEHGTRIARARLLDVTYKSTDPDVKLALRQTEDGDRYFFIRTEEHTRYHFGTIQVQGMNIDFSLEPFGAMIYYLPANASEGKWLPQLPQSSVRKALIADSVKVVKTMSFQDPVPTKWKKLSQGETLDDRGEYGRHLIYYRTKAPQGKLLTVKRIGDKVMNNTDGDEILASVDGRLLPIAKQDKESVSFQLPSAGNNRPVYVTLLYESKGLQHHTNKAVEDHWGIGITSVTCEGKELKLQYANKEKATGLLLSKDESSFSNPNADLEARNNPLLAWNVFRFNLPKQNEGEHYPYHLLLKHTGNGFIYLNGHCIGRCWQKDPQTEYYLPECWLNFGGVNRIAISLRPTEQGARISDLKVMPITF